MTVSQTKSAIREAARSGLNKQKGSVAQVGERIEIDEYVVDLRWLLDQEPELNRHKPDEWGRYIVHAAIDLETRLIVSSNLQPLDD
ncbi:hypothetical protein [Salipiger mangrovisoli]|uniref:Transposase n=1 Tax=Salipiger mangrovisoli TaxID=2865933 RepID=A0ABR9XBK9_9RHOB|nr:hypothetical protein [Salipiger mangrovisoli]MBE9640766.1 hypothetical protein [Salipiger mangrovisoli]